MTPMPRPPPRKPSPPSAAADGPPCRGQENHRCCACAYPASSMTPSPEPPRKLAPRAPTGFAAPSLRPPARPADTHLPRHRHPIMNVSAVPPRNRRPARSEASLAGASRGRRRCVGAPRHPRSEDQPYDLGPGPDTLTLWGARSLLAPVTCIDRRLVVIGNDDHPCLAV